MMAVLLLLGPRPPFYRPTGVIAMPSVIISTQSGIVSAPPGTYSSTSDAESTDVVGASLSLAEVADGRGSLPGIDWTFGAHCILAVACLGLVLATAYVASAEAKTVKSRSAKHRRALSSTRGIRPQHGALPLLLLAFSVPLLRAVTLPVQFARLTTRPGRVDGAEGFPYAGTDNVVPPQSTLIAGNLTGDMSPLVQVPPPALSAKGAFGVDIAALSTEVGVDGKRLDNDTTIVSLKRAIAVENLLDGFSTAAGALSAVPSSLLKGRLLESPGADGSGDADRLAVQEYDDAVHEDGVADDERLASIVATPGRPTFRGVPLNSEMMRGRILGARQISTYLDPCIAEPYIGLDCLIIREPYWLAFIAGTCVNNLNQAIEPSVENCFILDTAGNGTG